MGLPLALLLGWAASTLAAPGAQKPPLGYNNWNMFHNRINTSLFHETAQFMKSSGLLDSGYDLVVSTQCFKMCPLAY